LKKQVVGSIQKTNDLDVHIALLSAPSYAMEVKNKYYSRTKTPHQIIREHIDMFGKFLDSLPSQFPPIAIPSHHDSPYSLNPYLIPCFFKGFMQKNVNALDILIEDAKITLQGWGSPGPSFMLCNSKLTMQVLRSNPEFLDAMVPFYIEKAPFMGCQIPCTWTLVEMEWAIMFFHTPSFACRTIPWCHGFDGDIYPILTEIYTAYHDPGENQLHHPRLRWN